MNEKSRHLVGSDANVKVYTPFRWIGLWNKKNQEAAEP